MPGISLEDLRIALLSYNRSVSEAVSKAQAIEIARQELNKAHRILQMHEIHSPSRGVIKTIFKRSGEAVKSLETVFLIQVPDD